MPQTVQSSFNDQCPVSDSISVILSCGNKAYNNFIFGTKQNIDYFSFIQNKAQLQVGCDVSALSDALNSLSCPVASIPPQVTNNINNTTIINQDAWDSIEW